MISLQLSIGAYTLERELAFTYKSQTVYLQMYDIQ